jgi:hypothetical protein
MTRITADQAADVLLWPNPLVTGIYSSVAHMGPAIHSRCCQQGMHLLSFHGLWRRIIRTLQTRLEQRDQ